MTYICKIPNEEEMNKKWDYEIEHAEDKYNWQTWKQLFINRYKNNEAIPYYGILDGEIISEATASISKNAVENYEGLIDEKTAYLSAFRTNEGYRGQGYFSQLFKFMVNDLKNRGYTRLTIGVEPTEITNKAIYTKYGFTNLIKTEKDRYPDGTEIMVEYYSKDI